MTAGRTLSLKYAGPCDFKLLDENGDDLAHSLMITKMDIKMGVGTLPEVKMTTLIHEVYIDKMVVHLDEDQLKLWANAQGYNLVER